MAILDLLIVISSIVITITSFYLFYYYKKLNQITLEKQRRRTGSLLQRLTSIVMSFTLLICFTNYEFFLRPITITNKYTLFMLFLLAVQVFGVMVRRQFDQKMK